MLPMCLGFELERAEEILTSAGLTVQVTVTRPPRGGEPQGVARVVRQRLDPQGCCQLVVAYRDYTGSRAAHAD
ncbi:MAG: hypothetical protein M0Z55_11885 [Peptococcaceae bacterium]|nr:hypothetical protein [Peptococcaceae bacterium]